MNLRCLFPIVLLLIGALCPPLAGQVVDTAHVEQAVAAADPSGAVPSAPWREGWPPHWPTECGAPAPSAVLRQAREAPRFRLPGVLYHPSAIIGWKPDAVLAVETTKNRVRTQHRGGLFPPALQAPSDTLYLRRETKALVRSDGDTLRIEEQYRRNHYWTLDRFRRKGDPPGPGGPPAGADWEAVGSQWRFNPEGQPEEELWCEPDARHCRLWRRIAYWPSGEPAREGAFNEGVATGLHRAWYPDGRLRACLEYHDGRLLAVHGLYGPSGEALPIGTFRDGNGTVIRYALTGDAMGENRFKNGKRRGYKAYK